MEKIRLTQTVQKGGCAAKVAAAELRKILENVRFPEAHPALLVDGRHFDDAAIYKITDDTALVQTIDFFTPIVDSPHLFGRVASCNAVSDVYAMGGRPITALGVLAFPTASLDNQIIGEVLQGASDLLSEAKTNFVGGHSIDDDTLKFGLAVTGLVHPDRIWTNQGAQIGDQLILTKPLGTGASTAALKRSEVTEEEISDVMSSMTRLNNAVEYLSPDEILAIHAATDITGFGLSGHSWQLSRASRRGLQFEFDALPIFKRAQEFIEAGFLTKAHRTNREYTSEHLNTGLLDGWRLQIIHDPQTSGGLLLSVSKDHADSVLSALKSHFPGVAIVGEVTSSAPGVTFL